MPYEYNRTICIISMLICFYQSVITISRFKDSIVRPVLIFIIGFLITNCQCYIDLILNNITENYWAFISSNTINKGALLTAISLTAFSISYFGCNVGKTKIYCVEEDKQSKGDLKIFAYLQLLAFMWWLVTLPQGFITGQFYLSSGAHDADTTSYPIMLFKIAQFASLTSFIKSNPKITNFIEYVRAIPKIVLVTSFLFMAILIMAGDRGGAIYTLVLYSFCYIFITKYKPRIIIIIPVILLSAFLMTSVKYGRQFGNEKTFTEKITYLYQNQEVLEDVGASFSPYTAELANSVSCTHVAINDIQNKGKSFHFGAFHICYVLQTIPFLGSIIIDSLNIPTINRSSSLYITTSFYGKDFTSGLGTSLIADYYLEFGVLGILLEFLILGYVFSKIDIYFNKYPSNIVPWWIIILILYFSATSISIPRGYIFATVRTIVYLFLYYFIIRNIIVKNFK